MTENNIRYYLAGGLAGACALTLLVGTFFWRRQLRRFREMQAADSLVELEQSNFVSDGRDIVVVSNVR
jgi:hypothetical protein